MDLLRASPVATQPDPPPDAPSAEDPSPPPADQPSLLKWDDESLHWLISETPPLKQRVVLKRLAEEAGRPVSAAQLREALEQSGAVTTHYSGRALGAILRGLGKRSAWYERPSPFASWWDHDAGENRYRMPPEYGPPVLAALAELHGPDARPA
jgi:hypothetical protein